jgi:hypothetical protein
VSADGVVLSACRYLDTSSHGIKLPLGLGGRHMAAASITRQTSAVAFVVSESSVVRMFNAGRLVAEIIPEVWAKTTIRPACPERLEVLVSAAGGVARGWIIMATPPGPLVWHVVPEVGIVAKERVQDGEDVVAGRRLGISRCVSVLGYTFTSSSVHSPRLLSP